MNVIAHLDPEGPAERCPTCGQRVATFTTDEGTSYYLATAEQEASEAAFLREQLAGAVSATEYERLHAALRLIASGRARDPVALAQETIAPPTPSGGQ